MAVERWDDGLEDQKGPDQALMIRDLEEAIDVPAKQGDPSSRCECSQGATNPNSD